MKSGAYIFVAGLAGFCQITTTLSQVICSGEFESISAVSFVESLVPGWNLGNTLDSFPNEDSWNNQPVVESTFDDVKTAGFHSVRIPVTWAYHFTGTSNQGDSPSWTVDPDWLQRVSDVIDMATSRDLYVIVNVHHDSALWANMVVNNANWTLIEEKFYRLWYQIGSKLACKPHLVAFEPINEPPSETAEEAAELHKLNDIFLQAINDSGGFNAQRVVTLCGPGQDIFRTSEWFKAPDPKFSNPWAIQVHYYGPYAFTSAAWGKTIWGSETDKAELESDFAQLRGNFNDIPIVLGEWLVSPVHSEPAARWKYYDFLSQMAVKYKFAPIIWDTGNDHLDRQLHVWRDPTSLEIHRNALSGISNSLPDSTTDTSATSQFTSAYVFHRVGDLVTEQTLPMLFNGNYITNIVDESRTLVQGTDYSLVKEGILLSASYLSTYFQPASATGQKTTITVSFSAGAKKPIEVVQWDAPTVDVSQSAAIAGLESSIDINFNGVGKPATVAAYKPDGTPLIDEWTVYLPPLQQGRTTFGGQWTWNWGQNGVTITGNAASAVVSAGQPATFVIEAYPRTEGNYVNYTMIP